MPKIPLNNLKIIPQQCKYYNSYVLLHNAKTQQFVDRYSLDIITRGVAKLTVDGFAHDYKKGEICFRRHGQFNQQNHDSPYECLYLWFRVAERDTGKIIYPDDERDHFFKHIPTHIPAEQGKEIKETVSKLYKHMFSDSEYDKLMTETLLYLLTAQLYKLTEKEKAVNASTYHPAVRKAISFINSHIGNAYSMNELAGQCKISTKHLQTLFKKNTGQTPNDYINEKRIENAKFIMLTTDIPIIQVAFECGFSDNTYFTRVFKKYTGKTPTEYRNEKK